MADRTIGRLENIPGRVFGNFLRTGLLLAALTGLALAVGQRFGGSHGMTIAIAFVGTMNFGAWWFSDRIALAIHRAEPLERKAAPEVHRLVASLAHKAGVPMPRLFLIPIETPNAFATGRDPEHAALAVTSGLLEIMDRNELAGVIGHELAHVKNRDTLTGTIAATLAGLITHIAQSIFWFGGAFFSGHSDEEGEEGHGGRFASLGVLLVAPIAATLLQLAVSRSREFGADETGARIAGDPEALARALRKLELVNQRMPYDRAPATSHLFIVSPLSCAGVMQLFSTHPSVDERVRRLRALATAPLDRPL
jgi:heat shock protein HtpX